MVKLELEISKEFKTKLDEIRKAYNIENDVNLTLIQFAKASIREIMLNRLLTKERLLANEQIRNKIKSLKIEVDNL